MSEGMEQQEHESKSIGVQVPFECTNGPGCYVCDRNGQMLRVPEDLARTESFPPASTTDTEPLFVTKISDDPFVSISKARMLAANRDLNVNF